MQISKQKLISLFKKNYINSTYIIFLGIISSYSLPPYNYFVINFISFSLFFIFLYKIKSNVSNNINFFKYGWYFGFGYFLFSLYWIVISLTFDQNFKFMIPLALILVPSFLAVFYGVVTYLFSVLYSKNIIISFLIFSILFGIIEFTRGFVFTGFPWNLISFSFSNNIYFIQILSVIGTYSFNLICISFFTVPALFFLKKSNKEIIVGFFFVVIFISFIIFGYLKNNKFNLIKNVTNPFIIKAISSDISLDRFYSKKDEKKIIDELIFFSSPNKKKPTIFLWPEGIIPDSYIKDMDMYSNLFSNNFGKDDLIIMGLNSVQKENGKDLFFNSMAVFDNELRLIHKYNKVNLVPFGEFIPFENILSLVGLKTVTNQYQSFSKGEARDLIYLKNNKINLKLLPLICYEIIYSGRLSKNIDFDYIINISEDGWFGNSIGPNQHFSHSIFRSIETGKYIIRSANNGVSAIINPMGIVEQKVALGSTGHVSFSESKPIKPTFFLSYGNKIFPILILLYIFLIFSFNRFKK